MRPRDLFTAATVSYLANCALGAGVATRILRTDEVRWVHHGLYSLTSALGVGAVSSLVWSGSRAGWFLLPAAVPFFFIPRRSARSSGHIVLALSAAPFFAVSLLAAHTEPESTETATTKTATTKPGEQKA